MPPLSKLDEAKARAIQSETDLRLTYAELEIKPPEDFDSLINDPSYFSTRIAAYQRQRIRLLEKAHPPVAPPLTTNRFIPLLCLSDTIAARMSNRLIASTRSSVRRPRPVRVKRKGGNHQQAMRSTDSILGNSGQITRRSTRLVASSGLSEVVSLLKNQPMPSHGMETRARSRKMWETIQASARTRSVAL